MNRQFRLVDLPEIHPQLTWGSIVVAAAAVLEANSYDPRAGIRLSVEGIPNFAEREIRLFVDSTGIPREELARIERTYEPSRLVEMAAIAIAGGSLYHIGGHVISDIALRRSGADYLIDNTLYFLEVAGRTQRSEASKAWNERWQRLQTRSELGFFLFVVEFETFTARLAYSHPLKG